MELRSSRSRSKTPFVLDSFDETGGNFMTMEGRKTVTTRSSKRVQKSNNISQESMLEEEYSINARHVKPTRRSSRAKTFIKTSDYSSEDNEDNEVSSSSRMISENAKNKILEDAKLAAGTNTGVTALGLYRRAKRYWDEYPKTDWTYSPFSKDRVEIAPGVVAMPNMSRRAIHSYEMSEKGTNTDSATYTSLKPTRLFSSTQANNNYYKTTQQRSIFRRIVTSVLTIVTMFFLSITSTISYGYWGFHHVAVWLAKKVHHLTSKVMLLDTWLLRSNSYGGNKTRRVLLLCLLPLLLIGGWWFLSSLGPYLNETLNQKTAPFQQNTNPELYQFVQKDAPSIESTLTQKQLEKIAILVKNLNSNEENEQNRNILLNYQSKTDQNMADISTKIKTQEDLIHNLKNELYTIKTNTENQTNPENEERILNLEHAIENHQKLLLELKTCCNKNPEIIPINIEEKIQASINQFFENQKEQDTSSLEAKITTLKNDLDQKLDVLKTNFDAILKNKEHELIETIAVKIKSELSSLNAPDSSNTISDIKIMSIVQNALKIYDADRTGLVDYAMEPMGGQILTTRCTESYNSRSAVVSIFGLPLYYTTKSPRVVITPNLMVPGECWAFQNFPGLLVIKLPGPVLVESFSLEHISKLLVSNGNIDSAPKDFSVFGLESENDKMGILIGDYVYDYNGDSLQFFHAQNPGLVFEYIEIRITSNHGNPNYTCLYRFRVHGKMQK